MEPGSKNRPVPRKQVCVRSRYVAALLVGVLHFSVAVVHGKGIGTLFPLLFVPPCVCARACVFTAISRAM